MQGPSTSVFVCAKNVDICDYSITCAYVYVYVCVCIYIYIYTRASVRACIHTSISLTYIHTHLHIDIHMHNMHTHTHMSVQSVYNKTCPQLARIFVYSTRLLGFAGYKLDAGMCFHA